MRRTIRSALAALTLGGLLGAGLASLAQAQEPAQPPPVDASKIKEHWTVFGADTEHVGTVDKVEGDRIELSKNDPAASGTHHAIPLSWVATAADGKVVLKKTGTEAMAEWKATDRPSGDPKK